MLEKVVPIRPEEVVSSNLEYIMHEVNEIIKDESGMSNAIEIIIPFQKLKDIMLSKYDYSPLDVQEVESVIKRFKLAGWSVIPCGNGESSWYFTPKNR